MVSSPARRSGARPMGTVVYESVRDAIIEGRYGADEKLVQEQVAGDLGVSRTPVRDALNRLAQEGLVTWLPGSGYLVNDLTDQDITEVFEVRRNLEVLALEKSCGRLSRVQASRINTIIEEMAAADPTDAAAQFDLNRRFHQAMIEPAGNQLLLTMLDQLWDHPVSRRITRSYIHDEENVGRMIEEHRQILQACLDDDVQRLTTLSEKHMTEGYGETLSEAT
ncbi:GntR family transcriptional regulator [Segeticoccus rhizosphaerae]|uniref:GntR family transcriptional regulator n=1 Tax=Segeticoccus rhizosphaerae TaxID=1104777 RepID=UPI00138FF3A0|nr:GntR family transcriptional regulator [Ornithinicoccus soli]